MSTTSKKNIFKILFFIVLLGFIGVTIMYLTSKEEKPNPSNQLVELQDQLDKLKIKFYLLLLKHTVY